MPSLPPELADPVERLRAKLVEINGSEQTCMINVVANASQGKRLPEVQAVMARCRQASAAAATTAIDAFRHECSEIARQANSFANRAIVAATTGCVLGYWAKSESSAAAFASEIAADSQPKNPPRPPKRSKTSAATGHHRSTATSSNSPPD
jgi:hypothetical protein